MIFYSNHRFCLLCILKNNILSQRLNAICVNYSWDLTVNGQKFHLVHGCPGTDRSTRIWGRVDQDSGPPAPDTICIVGHTPTVYLTGRQDTDCAIWHGNGIIDIDCGCGHMKAAHRRLACLRLDDMAEFYVGGAADKPNA